MTLSILNRYREIPNGLKRSSDGADEQEMNVQRGIEQDAVGGGHSSL